VTGARAIFLDRDGVINVRPPEHEYVAAVDAFRWLPGAAHAIAALGRAGFEVVVVSNQRGIARGLVSWETLEAIEARIASDLRPLGGQVDAYYYCPHGLDDSCDCRKPRPGLLIRAARERGLDIRRSAIVGDSESDIEAGRAAGCGTTVLIASEGTPTEADAVVANLGEAVRILLAALDGAGAA
jgi:D-glycero-D-manno-heptose 1,7-bisphosphate phosphatase